jgi:hypothetical protein
MIQTLNFTTFANAFQNSSRADQFSYEALELIFDYIEDYERDTGEKVEFDMIAICCEWAENTPEELIEMYRIDIEPHEENDVQQAVIDYLNDETQIAGVTEKNTIVYCSSF